MASPPSPGQQVQPTAPGQQTVSTPQPGPGQQVPTTPQPGTGQQVQPPTGTGQTPDATAQTPDATAQTPDATGAQLSESVSEIFGLSDLEWYLIAEIEKIENQIVDLKDELFGNLVVPERPKKIFRNITKRCLVEMDCLMKSKLSGRRQTELRMNVEKKLDMLRNEVSKLRNLTNGVNRINTGNNDHVCRDVKNYYFQSGIAEL